MTEFRDTEPLLDHIDDDDYDEEVGDITKLFQPDYNSNGWTKNNELGRRERTKNYWNSLYT